MLVRIKVVKDEVNKDEADKSPNLRSRDHGLCLCSLYAHLQG